MTMIDTTRLRTAAKVWHDAGCSVIPAAADGSKRPFAEWTEYQQRRPEQSEIDGWLDTGAYDGIGLVCGAISGNLEMFEIEGRAADEGLYDRLGMAMIEAGYADLWLRLCSGYLERTPSGGFHWLYRVDGTPRGNLKLARRPATDGELLANPDEKAKVLIETRGEGGFTIVAPSGGRTHPGGADWTWEKGSPADIPTLTEDERDALHLIAATFDTLPAQERWEPKGRERQDGDPLRPGDDYNLRTDWAELLEHYGWTYGYTTHAGAAGWRRPGKSVGISATVGYGESDLLYVFSSSAHPLEPDESYSKFAVYAAYEHGGDFSAAAADLAAQGYGEPLPNPDSAESFAGIWTPAEAADAPGEDAAAKPTLHEQMVAKELAVLRAREEAKRLFAAERAALQFREPPNRPTLVEELAIPPRPVQFRVDRLLPVGGNILLPAQYKAGKTTTVNNFVAAVADGEPFLGRFDVTRPDGRIAVWNYEVGEDQYREWLREVGVKHPERVVVLNLRGYRVPLTSPTVEDWCVDWLKRHEVQVWALDPFARAATGIDENSNTEVGVWLDTFDVIKSRAGVLEGLLATHTGRAEQEAGQERARGATRLDDWADVRWILTRDEAGARFFRATGRDVEVEEEKLSWDAATRRSTFGGWDRKGEARRRLEDAVVAWIADNPGCSGEELEKQSGLSPQKGILAARDRALAGHRIRVEEVGQRGRKNHYANLI